MKGNCYVTCEALYHLLGGKKSGLKPMVVKHENSNHWFLELTIHHIAELEGFKPIKKIIDPTVSQFKSKPPYHKARGKGFLTKKPSKRAKKLMKELVYKAQE